MNSPTRISPPRPAHPQPCEKGCALYQAYSQAAHKLQVARRANFLTYNDVAQLLQAWELHRDRCEVCG